MPCTLLIAVSVFFCASKLIPPSALHAAAEAQPVVGTPKWLLLSWLRGGLAISTVGASAIFGAVSGVSVAGVAAVGSIAVPQMLDRGYDRGLAAGSVASSGALAMLIPPSVPFIIYGAAWREC